MVVSQSPRNGGMVDSLDAAKAAFRAAGDAAEMKKPRAFSQAGHRKQDRTGKYRCVDQQR
jgi:hypothetical protein